MHLFIIYLTNIVTFYPSSTHLFLLLLATILDLSKGSKTEISICLNCKHIKKSTQLGRQ